MSTSAQAPPVFLHSLWRAGSTYLFGKFREAGRYYCLYEPLHEFMARLDERHMAEYSSERVAEGLNHALMAGGYFDEYRALQRRGRRGIPGFRKSMSIADFFDGRSRSFRRYITGLITGCQAQGRQPFLQFCRSSGRLEFFRGFCGGTSVYLERNPRDQWQSYMGGEHDYYMPLTVAIATLRLPYATGLSTILQRPLPKARRIFGVFGRRSFRRPLEAARRFERELSDADRYRIFYAEWLRAGREARIHCDLVFDINGLTHEATVRERMEDTFSIQLDDCHVKEYGEHRLPEASMEEIEREVIELFEEMGSLVATSEVDSI